MIITISRSGGFIGIPQTKSIDTKTLDNEKALKIGELITKSNFFNLKQNQFNSSSQEQRLNQPDRFIYNINIQNDALSNTLNIYESQLTPELRELIKNIGLNP